MAALIVMDRQWPANQGAVVAKRAGQTMGDAAPIARISLPVAGLALQLSRRPVSVASVAV